METKLVRVNGPSMSPFIQDQDILKAKGHTPSNLQVGAFYLLQSDQNLIIHRYIGNNLFKGDSNRQIDQVTEVVAEIDALYINEKWISLDDKKIKWALKIQATLSSATLKRNFFGKVSFHLLKMFSYSLRTILCMGK